MAWLIPPLALVAGYFAWTRLPPGDGERNDPLESAYAVVLCGVLLAGLLAALLAGLGWLRPPALAGLLAACSVVFWRLPGRLPPASTPSRRDTAALLLLTACLVALAAPGSEDMFGGRDQGVYVNTAGWVAREGTLVIHSAPLVEVSTLEGGPFPLERVLMPGYHVIDARRGAVASQFLHLLPVLMALGAWVNGVHGALMVPPLLGVIGQLACFFFLRRLLGLAGALTGTLLLAVNLAQVWGVRNPYSEMFTQLSVLAALWCIACGHATGGLRWGILGAAALGSNFLNRIDAPLTLLALLPALVVLQAASAATPRWIGRALLPGTLLFAVWGCVHARLFSPIYFQHYLPLLRALWVAVASALVLALAAFRWRAQARRLLDVVYRRGTLAWIGGAIVLCALFVFGIWVRPGLEPFQVMPNHSIRSYREESLVRVGWYVSLPGLIFALSGVLVLLRRWLVERRVEWVPFILLFLVFSVLFFRTPIVHPDHPWMMRRYLSVTVPGILVAIAALAAWLWSVRGRWQGAARAVGALAVIAVAAHELKMTAPFWSFREQEGAVAQVARLARHVPEDALLLFPREGSAVRLATPLAFYWNRAILPVLPTTTETGAETRRRAFDAQIQQWLAAGRDVRFLAAEHGSGLITEFVEWREVTTFQLHMTTMNSGFEHAPRRPRELVETYRLLRAVPAAWRPCAPQTVRAEDPLLGRASGVYATESDSDDYFRWTAPKARIVFPACERQGAARPGRLRLRARCIVNAPCRVRITVNGERAGAVDLPISFADFEVPVPARAVSSPSGPIRVEFEAPGFVPAEMGMGADRRVLAFQFAELTLRSLEGASSQGSGPGRRTAR